METATTIGTYLHAAGARAGAGSVAVAVAAAAAVAVVVLVRAAGRRTGVARWCLLTMFRRRWLGAGGIRLSAATVRLLHGLLLDAHCAN